MRNVLLSHIPTAMFPGLLPRALRTLPRLSRHRPLCHFPPPPLTPTNLPHLRHLLPLSLPSLTRKMATSSTSQVIFTDTEILKSEPITSLQFILPDDQPVVRLDAATAFNLLGAREQLYSHYLSRASWLDLLTIKGQTINRHKLKFLVKVWWAGGSASNLPRVSLDIPTPAPPGQRAGHCQSQGRCYCGRPQRPASERLPCLLQWLPQQHGQLQGFWRQQICPKFARGGLGHTGESLRGLQG